MTAPMQTEILEQWLDGTLDSAGHHQLLDHLADAHHGSEILAQLETIALLRASLHAVAPEFVAARVKALIAARRPERQSATVGALRRRRRQGKMRSWVWPSAAAAAAALMILGWIGWMLADREDTVVVVSGSGTLHSREGAISGDRLTSGTELVAEKQLTLRWQDRSEMSLDPASRLVVDANGGFLMHGHLQANVSPRLPSKPFSVHTAHASITVVGTRFTISTDANVTAVAVDQGVVRVRNQLGVEQSLTAGERIQADASGWHAALAPAQPATVNVLDDQERAAGWILLFDGTSTTGWRGYRKARIPPRWIVRAGTLSCLPPSSPAEDPEDLVSKETYSDFDLRFEWQIAIAGNSGVFYRVHIDGSNAHDTGPEYQLVDAERHSDGKSNLTWSGACYGLFPPPRDLAVPAGGWNQSRIVVHGPNVEHWLNGTLAVRYVLGSDEWRRRVGLSKFARLPRYGRETSGHICLQGHGDAVSFRAIRILPLTPATP